MGTLKGKNAFVSGTSQGIGAAIAEILVKAGAAFLGSFDILINNSGSLVKRSTIQEVNLDYWKTVIDINLTTMMLLTKESALKTISSIPLGRSGNPNDVARAVAFLASEYDGFITGETIDINGGVYCA